MSTGIDAKDWRVWLVSGAAVAAQVTAICMFNATDPNMLAASIVQGIAVTLGAVVSYLVGKSSARDAAQDIVKPHVRSAFRRSVSLFGAVERLSSSLNEVYEGMEQEARDDGNGVKVVDLTVARWAFIGLQNLVRAQLDTAKDSLEDWKDLVPEEVVDLSGDASNESTPEGGS